MVEQPVFAVGKKYKFIGPNYTIFINPNNHNEPLWNDDLTMKFNKNGSTFEFLEILEVENDDVWKKFDDTEIDDIQQAAIVEYNEKFISTIKQIPATKVVEAYKEIETDTSIDLKTTPVLCDSYTMLVRVTEQNDVFEAVVFLGTLMIINGDIQEITEIQNFSLN